MSELEQRRIDGVRAVVEEQGAQLRKWGEQKHPDLHNPYSQLAVDRAKARTDQAAEDGTLTWQHILTEEFAEAMGAESLEELRTELVQVGAVALSWVNDIDRRGADSDLLTGESHG